MPNEKMRKKLTYNQALEKYGVTHYTKPLRRLYRGLYEVFFTNRIFNYGLRNHPY